MSGLARLMACFVSPEATETASGAPAEAGGPPRAAVVGSSGKAVLPVAAAVAGELRIRARASAALVALWHSGARKAGPAGAATPAARRLAIRLAATGIEATACGRLAWVILPDEPPAAAREAGKLPAAAAVPVVVGVCGPRPSALEPVLARQDIAIAVLPSDADPDLRDLALDGLAAPTRGIQPPLPPGPARWAALAGLSRLRSLPSLGPRGAGG